MAAHTIWDNSSSLNAVPNQLHRFGLRFLQPATHHVYSCMSSVSVALLGFLFRVAAPHHSEGLRTTPPPLPPGISLCMFYLMARPSRLFGPCMEPLTSHTFGAPGLLLRSILVVCYDCESDPSTLRFIR